ncbi:uncharacterized protein LOC135137824 [Zophobas morio]|uniref:uncharacterized protein LOC135137824 n=1 Tax=Zophobas morio TaxID=2755281 RepID=UPI0030836D98
MTRRFFIYENRKSTACCCCKKGTVSLRCVLERSANVCKESVKLKATIDNQSEVEECCEFVIDRGVLGVSKDLKHHVFEYRGSNVKLHSRSKWDGSNSLVLPPMPTTLVGICRLVQIYYVLSVSLDSDKDVDVAQVNFPITIAIVPLWIPNTNTSPTIRYEHACSHVEGGQYIGPEFLLGQVYDGNEHHIREPIVLYKPLYVTVDKSETN